MCTNLSLEARHLYTSATPTKMDKKMNNPTTEKANHILEHGGQSSESGVDKGWYSGATASFSVESNGVALSLIFAVSFVFGMIVLDVSTDTVVSSAIVV